MKKRQPTPAPWTPNPAAQRAAQMALLDQYLKDPASGWSIGILGAIGEFGYDQDEPVTIELDGVGKSVVTPRGAITVHLTADVHCLAYETIGSDGRGWMHGLLFCLPEGAASLPTHRVLTKIGPDHDSVVSDRRTDPLFDLGLGSPYLQFCVRSNDRELLSVMRRYEGTSVFDPANPAWNAIREASPHRVIVSRLGRIEVYQAIPAADGHHKSPTGPHTHVLPELLATRRTHAETIPIPDGWVPGLALYPPHPLHDQQGHPHPFDRNAHQVFQELLARYGAADYLAQKARITRAVLAGHSPDAVSPIAHNLTCRIALRQAPHLHDHLPGLEAWMAACQSNEQ